MSEHEQQVEEGKQILLTHATQLLPDEVQLSWKTPADGKPTLIATHDGSTSSLFAIEEIDLSDIPGGYRDRSGDDRHWPHVKTQLTKAVHLWKQNR
jgi:hypothetical protein